MANVHSGLRSLFTDLANAIRAKKNTTDLIDADAFPTEIADITTGDTIGFISGDISEVLYKDLEGLTSIRPYAFYGCSNLTSIDIPYTVTSIGENAFANCSNLTDIYVEWYEGEVAGAPWGAENATIHYPSAGLAYTLNSDGASYSVSKGECTDADVTIPKYHEGLPVTRLGNAAFSYSSKLTSIYIPDSVIEIDRFSFKHCSSLTSLAIPDSVTTIGEEVFYECSSLTAVDLPAGLTSIEEDTFYHCTSLTSIIIPDSVTEIGDAAFCKCTSLASVTISDSVTEIAGRAFSECTSLASITIPDSVTKIGQSAFSHCRSLTSITIPKSVDTILDNPVSYCYKLTSIDVDLENANFVSVDGVLYDKDKEKLMGYPGGKADTTYDIPDSVTSIGQSAFSECTNLVSITIPDSVMMIDRAAFSGCFSLTSIKIPYGVTSIGTQTFYACKSLTSIEIPDSVTSIGDRAFGYCTSLISVEIPDGVGRIEQNAFSYCAALTSIKIPYSVTNISSTAFNCSDNLTDIYVEWYEGEVAGAPWGAENATIHYPSDGLAYTLNPDEASYSVAKGECTDAEVCIAGLYNGLPVTRIADSGFYDCDNLTSVDIPGSVTVIGSEAFSGCGWLPTIYIPVSVTHIYYRGLFFGKLGGGSEFTYGGTCSQWYKVYKEKQVFYDRTIIHCTDGDVTYIDNSGEIPV